MHSIGTAEARFDEKLLALSSEIDEFEGYVEAHGLRIAYLADAIGKRFKLAPHDLFFLQQASLLHDLGEFAMRREYIAAGRNLTSEERIDLERHPVIGEQEAAKRGLSRGVQLLIRWHHEWWDGSGYPDGLAGEDIPLAARILRVADTYAALTSVRPRRTAMTLDDAKRHMAEWAAIEFDPRVVHTLLSLEDAAVPIEEPMVEAKVNQPAGETL
jgi:HD-GYP domain-containing protein (c-di-GMP phosphodiesterase class II)